MTPSLRADVILDPIADKRSKDYSKLRVAKRIFAIG